MYHSDEWMSGWNHGAFGPWLVIGIVVAVLLVLLVTMLPKR